MTLVACGVNHLTAPVGIRERIAFSPVQAKSALIDIMQLKAVNEAMVLSTCNRVEIYSDIADPTVLQHWLARHFENIPTESLYSYHEEKAVSHLMRVASGLDSMVVGEPQILGQMKSAFALAKEAGSVGKRLNNLLQTVFSVSKRVRYQTAIGANPITLGFAAVTLGKQIFSNLSKCSVLLIGSGEIIESSAKHFYSQGVKRFIVANRSQENAEKLAKKIYAHTIALADVPIYLREADIIISATSSELPILAKGAMERAIKARKHRPMLMVDLAVPRDFEPEIGTLEDVYLYNIDDLRSIVQDNRSCRDTVAKEAEKIIEIQARHYMLELQSQEANALIKNYRENLTALSQKDYKWALHSLAKGSDPKEVLEQFAQNLIKKIAHTPSAQMKKAAFDGRFELLAFARQLLDIQ